MPQATDPPAEHDAVQEMLRTSESTAFYVWLLITVSAGIIMAQDSWYSLQNPRLDTGNVTATFTKVLVIHALWFLISLGFVVYTWIYRPSVAWKLHLVVGVATCIWTLGVVGWAFRDVERLEVSVWMCTAEPAAQTVTAEFLDTCSPAESRGTIRMGSDIYLWSRNDTDFWRWIVPGDGKETIRIRWPSGVSAIYLASTDEQAALVPGSSDIDPGGIWSAGFDPATDREFRIFYIESAAAQVAPAGPTAAVAIMHRQVVP